MASGATDGLVEDFLGLAGKLRECLGVLPGTCLTVPLREGYDVLGVPLTNSLMDGNAGECGFPTSAIFEPFLGASFTLFLPWLYMFDCSRSSSSPISSK